MGEYGINDGLEDLMELESGQLDPEQRAAACARLRNLLNELGNDAAAIEQAGVVVEEG